MTFKQRASDTMGKTLWEHTSPPGPDLEPISSPSGADVAVIGAGVAGLSTALHLAEAGVTVTVLEADHIGSGATGKSGGLLAPDTISHSPLQIESLLGRKAGSRLLKMIGSSAQQVFDLIEKHGFECDARQSGFWTPAHDDETAAALKRKADEWQERGFKVRYAPAEETASNLGTDRYSGAMEFEEGGTLNPLAFSRSLAGAILRRGGRIHVRSPVIELRRAGAGWEVRTDQSVLEAKQVILAANGGNQKLHPALRRTVVPLEVIEFATVPLTSDQQFAVLSSGAGFTDKQRYIFTARYDADKRLVSAFPDFMIRRSETTLLAEAAGRIERYFPILQGTSIEYLWAGTAWVSPALLPKIYRLEDGAIALQACNGRGLSTNVVLGRELAAAVYTGDISNLSVDPEIPAAIRGYPLARHLPSLLMLWAYLWRLGARAFGR